MAAIALVLGAIGSAHAATLNFVQVAPLTGNEASIGKAYSAGLQLAFNNANKAGGVNGHTLNLVRKDDAGQPEETVAATQQLLNAQRPLALTGYFGSRNIASLVQSGVLQKEKIALVGYRATSAPADAALVYNVRASLEDEFQKIMEHQALVGQKRMGVLTEEGPAAAGIQRLLEESAKRAGVQLVARASYPAGSSQVSKAVDALVGAAPQTVLLVANSGAVANFIEQFRLSGGSARMVTPSFIDVEQLIRRLGEDSLEGVAMTQVTPNPYKTTLPLSKELRDAYGAASPKPDVPISYAMMEGFIAGKVIAEAVRRMGATPTREGFVAALEQIDAYDLGGYRVAFKPGARQGSRFVELSIVSGSGRVRQ